MPLLNGWSRRSRLLPTGSGTTNTRAKIPTTMTMWLACRSPTKKRKNTRWPRIFSKRSFPKRTRPIRTTNEPLIGCERRLVCNDETSCGKPPDDDTNPSNPISTTTTIARMNRTRANKTANVLPAEWPAHPASNEEKNVNTEKIKTSMPCWTPSRNWNQDTALLDNHNHHNHNKTK